MVFYEFIFKDYPSRTELSNRLGVPPRALDVISFTGSLCKRCNRLPAVLNNQGRCVSCQQTWFPRELKENGERAKHCRGHGLLGPQFMRLFGEGINSPKSCACSMQLCEKIGYSHAGTFRFPTKPDECAIAMEMLNIPSERRPKIASNPRNFAIAPWHYSPEHRTLGANQCWTMKKLDRYVDHHGAEYSFPPPNWDVQRFIDEEVDPPTPLGDETLPDWVQAYICAQTGMPPPADIVQANTKKNAAGKKRILVPGGGPARKRRAQSSGPAVVDLRISPGRLGLGVMMQGSSSVVVSSIDEECTFRDHVSVGDRLVSIDGRPVTCIEDVSEGADAVRIFQFEKRAVAQPQRAKPSGTFGTGRKANFIKGPNHMKEQQRARHDEPLMELPPKAEGVPVFDVAAARSVGQQLLADPAREKDAATFHTAVGELTLECAQDPATFNARLGELVAQYTTFGEDEAAVAGQIMEERQEDLSEMKEHAIEEVQAAVGALQVPETMDMAADEEVGANAEV